MRLPRNMLLIRMRGFCKFTAACFPPGTSFHPSPEFSRCSASFPLIDVHGRRAFIIMAAITHIQVHLANRVTDHPFHLLHLCRQRVAVIGTSRKAPCSEEPSATTADCHADLVAKLVPLARFALGDALHRGLMHAVDLVFVMPLLRMDVARRL